MEYYDYGSTDGRVTYIPSSTNGRSQKRNRMAVSNPKPSLSLVGTRSSNQGKLWLSLPFCPSTPMHRVLNPVHYGQSLDPTPIGGASLGEHAKIPDIPEPDRCLPDRRPADPKIFRSVRLCDVRSGTVPYSGIPSAGFEAHGSPTVK